MRWTRTRGLCHLIAAIYPVVTEARVQAVLFAEPLPPLLKRAVDELEEDFTRRHVSHLYLIPQQLRQWVRQHWPQAHRVYRTTYYSIFRFVLRLENRGWTLAEAWRQIEEQVRQTLAHEVEAIRSALRDAQRGRYNTRMTRDIDFQDVDALVSEAAVTCQEFLAGAGEVPFEAATLEGAARTLGTLLDGGKPDASARGWHLGSEVFNIIDAALGENEQAMMAALRRMFLYILAETIKKKYGHDTKAFRDTDRAGTAEELEALMAAAGTRVSEPVGPVAAEELEKLSELAYPKEREALEVYLEREQSGKSIETICRERGLNSASVRNNFRGFQRRIRKKGR
ncbi:MAG: hypothetical protein HY683_05955 [Chloroflexi bacterium]|nr:hypothetical protein [Chloroflexota bacterium]